MLLFEEAIEKCLRHQSHSYFHLQEQYLYSLPVELAVKNFAVSSVKNGNRKQKAPLPKGAEKSEVLQKWEEIFGEQDVKFPGCRCSCNVVLRFEVYYTLDVD